MIDLATLNGRIGFEIMRVDLKVTLIGESGLVENWSRRPDLNQVLGLW